MTDTPTTDMTTVDTGVDLSAIGAGSPDGAARDDDMNAQLMAVYHDREAGSGGPEGGDGAPGTQSGNEAEGGDQGTPQTPTAPATGTPADGAAETGAGSGTPPIPPEAPGGEKGGATADPAEGAQAPGADQAAIAAAAQAAGGEAEEGGEGEGEQQAQDPTPVEWGGQRYTDDDMADMVQLKLWRGSLTPQATAAVDAVLGGTHVVVPRETAQRWAQMEQRGAPAGGFPDPAPAVQPGVQPYVQPGQPYGAPPGPQPQPYVQPGQPYGTPAAPVQPPVQTDPFAGMDLSGLDDEVVAVLRAQHAASEARIAQVTQQVGQFQQYMEGQAQMQAAQQRQEADAKVNAGLAAFMADTGLDPAVSEALLARVGQLQMLPGLVNQHGGDIALATQDALSQVAWLDPTARQAMALKEGMVDTGEATAADARRQKAASLTGGSGSIPRPGGAGGAAGGINGRGGGGDGEPKLTRTQEMAKAIADAQGDGVPG